MNLRWLALIPLLCAGLVHAAEPELLEPEKAFAFSARVAGSDSIEVRYVIAKGYYMYRDKFRFVLEPATVARGEPLLPPGKLKKDEFFGETAVYRDEVRITLPINRDEKVDRVMLTAVSQGCADVGVCYVPVEQKAELRLVTGATGGTSAASDGALSQLFAGSRNAPGGSPAPLAKGEDDLVADLFHGEAWLLIISFFVFGLLLSFRPFLLPMVAMGRPLTSAE